MATSQDFVNWVCGPDIASTYLHYILVAEQESIRRFAHGTTHQTMYYPEAKALHVLLPSRPAQDAIAEVLGALDDKIAANSVLIASASELAISLAARIEPSVPLGAVAAHQKLSRDPLSIDERLVSHFSLPAFDNGQSPELVSPASIKSLKSEIRKPAVLVSKLNPRFPRLWDVTHVGPTTALASTEFLVLESLFASSTVLWAAISQPSFSESLESQVSGTSGSHQRVRPTDLLATQIIDPRDIDGQVRDSITALGQRISSCRSESAALLTVRDALLPQLMSGKIRVKDAERIAGAVS